MDLRAFREGLLDRLAAHVRFDAAMVHAMSPRVPLETGAFRGLAIEEVRATLPEWDRYAVELGRFRDVALAHGGVATDREAFPARGRVRTTFEQAFGPKRVRAAALVHLVVRDRIIGLVMLLRRRDEPFTRRDVALLRSVAPTIAIGDALHQCLDGLAQAPVPVRLVCRDQRLTERQREIAEHVALGHTNAQIGDALELSANTVRNQLAMIMKRLGAGNRADVVRLAVLRGA